MNEGDTALVRHYLARVRRGLRGLPNVDVDDTIEEMRVHLLEEIGEGRTATTVLADFGDADAVAAEIVERRLAPDDGPVIGRASVARRYSAWATDVVVGFGPLVLVPTALAFPAVATGLFGTGVPPIWLQLVSIVLERWVMSPAELATYTEFTVIPAWQWVLLAVLIGWALFYWLVLRRQRSASLGMWMTGLRGLIVDGDRLVVRERDIVQHPLPADHGRNRWWILVVAVPTGCLCILLAAYYIGNGVWSFVQPWDVLRGPFTEREDHERGIALCEDFYEAVTLADEPAALALCEPAARDEARELIARIDGQDDAMRIGPWKEDGVVVLEYEDRGGVLYRRETALVYERTERVDGHDYIASYRISVIDLGEEWVIDE
jgi:hypothetical protein